MRTAALPSPQGSPGLCGVSVIQRDLENAVMVARVGGIHPVEVRERVANDGKLRRALMATV